MSGTIIKMWIPSIPKIERGERRRHGQGRALTPQETTHFHFIFHCQVKLGTYVCNSLQLKLRFYGIVVITLA